MVGKHNSEKKQFREPALEIEEDKKQLVSEKIPSQNGWISEEIQFCILRNLPRKSHMRFKCVNKSWNFMISDYYLSNKSPKLILCDEPSVFLMDYENPVKGGKLDLPISGKLIRVWASCKGIVWITVDRQNILWNPFTGEHKIMRRLFLETVYGSKGCGFVYDHTINDYKIISIPEYDCTWKPFIYSVKKDYCETLEEIKPRYLSMTFRSKVGVSVENGSFCYWPIVYQCFPRNNSLCPFCHNYAEGQLIGEEHPVILGLDVINTRHVLLPQPPGRAMVTKLTDFKGFLCVVKTDNTRWIKEMWLLKENWVKLMSIDMTMSNFSGQPICITNHEEVLMRSFDVGSYPYRKQGILVYAPYNSIEKRFQFVKNSGLDNWCHEIVHSETLCSIET